MRPNKKTFHCLANFFAAARLQTQLIINACGGATDGHTLCEFRINKDRVLKYCVKILLVEKLK